MRLPRVLSLAHRLAARALRGRSRPLAIDATMGNGHDTLVLARLVGDEGLVIGLDVQPEALAATRQRLADHGLLQRALLQLESHENLAEQVDAHGGERELACVLFNLGYRPGGDPTLTTRPDSTLAALGGAVERLAPGGAIGVVVYPAHPGGGDEAAAVCEWARGLDSENFEVARYEPLNRSTPAPFLIAITRPTARNSQA